MNWQSLHLNWRTFLENFGVRFGLKRSQKPPPMEDLCEQASSSLKISILIYINVKIGLLYWEPEISPLMSLVTRQPGAPPPTRSWRTCSSRGTPPSSLRCPHDPDKTCHIYPRAVGVGSVKCSSDCECEYHSVNWSGAHLMANALLWWPCCNSRIMAADCRTTTFDFRISE